MTSALMRGRTVPCMACGRRGSGGAARSRRGATLVEVGIALFLLSIVALAGNEFVLRSRIVLNEQQCRRVATDVAAGRIEELLATPQSQLMPIIPRDYVEGYLQKAGGTWVYTRTDPGEMFDVNGRRRPGMTRVQFVDVGGGAVPHGMVCVTVRLAYHENPDDRVSLQTMISP